MNYLSLSASTPSIHALAPLVFFKNSIKFFYKKIFGFYIKFISFFLNTTIVFNVFLLLSVLPWSDFNVVTAPIFFFIFDIFASAMFITFLLNFDGYKKLLSKVSGITEADLDSTFTLKKTARIGGAIVAGAGIARADDYLHKSSNIDYLQSYTSHMKSIDGAIDANIIRDIMSNKSFLQNFSSSLPHLVGKELSFEDLKNINKPK